MGQVLPNATPWNDVVAYVQTFPMVATTSLG